MSAQTLGAGLADALRIVAAFAGGLALDDADVGGREWAQLLDEEPTPQARGERLCQLVEGTLGLAWFAAVEVSELTDEPPREVLERIADELERRLGGLDDG